MLAASVQSDRRRNLLKLEKDYYNVVGPRRREILNCDTVVNFYRGWKPLSREIDAKGSRKNNFTFYTSMHPARQRCESSEYPDIPAFSRLAGRAPQRLKL